MLSKVREANPVRMSTQCPLWGGDWRPSSLVPLCASQCSQVGRNEVVSPSPPCLPAWVSTRRHSSRLPVVKVPSSGTKRFISQWQATEERWVFFFSDGCWNQEQSRFLLPCFCSVSWAASAGNSGQWRSLPVVSAWLCQSISVGQHYDMSLFASEVIKKKKNPLFFFFFPALSLADVHQELCWFTPA